jgi:hypothetical protein
MLATHGYPQNQWFGTEDLDRFGTFFQHMCKDNFLGPMIRHPYGEWLSFWVNPQMSLVILFWHLVDSFELQSNSADGPQCSLIHYFQICTLPKFNMEAQEGHFQCWNHFKTIFLTFHAKLEDPLNHPWYSPCSMPFWRVQHTWSSVGGGPPAETCCRGETRVAELKWRSLRPWSDV